VSSNDINAVTWGVFKGKEIIQPTVVDHNAFLIWKDEIFSQWLNPWAVTYGTESESYHFLETCYNTFYLVNIVDNDYIGGDLNQVINDFIKNNEELITSLE